MRVTYDAQVDALYIEFRALPPGTAENRTVTDEVTLDYGPDGKIAGIEVIDASHVLGESLNKLTLEVAPALPEA